MLLTSLGASFLENMLPGRGIVRASHGSKDGKFDSTSSVDKLWNSKYQNEPRFNGVFSRDNLPYKIKDGAYVINLDEYEKLVHIGLLCFELKLKSFTLTVLELNMFLKELKNLLSIKTKTNL